VRQRSTVGRSESFTMKHAANKAQSGALGNDSHSNGTFKDNDLSYAHDAKPQARSNYEP
jgi:hypothetical protein